MPESVVPVLEGSKEDWEVKPRLDHVTWLWWKHQEGKGRHISVNLMAAYIVNSRPAGLCGKTLNQK